MMIRCMCISFDDLYYSRLFFIIIPSYVWAHAQPCATAMPQVIGSTTASSQARGKIKGLILLESSVYLRMFMDKTARAAVYS